MVGCQRADERNNATGFMQVQVSMRGRVTERRVGGKVGVVDQFAGECPLVCIQDQHSCEGADKKRTKMEALKTKLA
jgi:hypothetical protein